MYKTFILTFMCMLSLSLQAQNKTDRIKEIRQLYADAKNNIAQNGKDGNIAKDMLIKMNSVLSIEHDIYEEATLHVFFDEQRKVNVEDGSFNVYEQPYFMICQEFCHGHEAYRELMFDAKTGALTFAFIRSVTDAGMVFETRLYYDAKGKLIEGKSKTADANGLHVEDETLSESDGADWDKSIKESANCFMKIFKTAIGENKVSKTNKNTAPHLSKAEQIKRIRANYTVAQDKSSKKVFTFYPCDITITIHNQEEGDCPPVTDVISMFGEKANNDAGTPTLCFFATSHRSLMGFDNYTEFLFDPASYNLIFSYQRSAEQGEQQEWRYYFDEQGNCIDSKVNALEDDKGKECLSLSKTYQALFEMIEAGLTR